MITEAFFALAVRDMDRARTFYTAALGADVVFASPSWSSLRIAGVRVGLFPGEPGRTGLHFAGHLEAIVGEAAAAGGRVVSAAREIAPGVTIAEVEDSEGNTFTVRAD
jgi:predicted enzyme related to lactoylglutathione lyase